jgi:hypothetical protein
MAKGLDATDPVADLARRIAATEEAYEYMLAYAAQGRETDRGAQASPSIRDFLSNMDVALENLGAAVRAALAAKCPAVVGPADAFLDAVDADARKAQGALRLVLGQKAVSSQLIDNLNASIHVRALLTDLFVVDEALKRSG